MNLTTCWFQFRWGDVCTGVHTNGYHTVWTHDGPVDVMDAPVKESP